MFSKYVALSALYYGAKDESLDHWIGFHPIPVRYANGNKKVLKKAFSTYDASLFIQLKKRLQDLPQPYKPGIYKVEQETSDWKHSNYDLSVAHFSGSLSSLI